MTQYPRSRQDTDPPLNPSEAKELLQKYWDLEATDVQRANSSCVFFCHLNNHQVVFRANPGWDGPLPPSTIVRFVDHLSRSEAPCPEIVRTKDGQFTKGHGDFTLSVESFLEGETADRVDILSDIGKALAEIHDATENFHEFPPSVQPIAEYVETALAYCERLDLIPEISEAVKRLANQLRARLSNIDLRSVRWLLCRGDVRSWNTIAKKDGTVQFTDFNAAHFAPALTDVVMVRTQWLMGTQNRALTDSEMASFLRGYLQVRPQTEQELTAFPILWAAYYAQRLCSLHTKWKPDAINRTKWDLHNRIKNLPLEGIQMAERALQEATGFTTGPK